MAQSGSASFLSNAGNFNTDYASQNLSSFNPTAAGTPVPGTNISSTGLESTSSLLHNLPQYYNQRFLVATINGLVKKSKGKVLANPRIIVTNNQPSKIDISSDYIATRIQSQAITATGALAGVATTNYTTGQAGIQVTLTPRIASKWVCIY